MVGTPLCGSAGENAQHRNVLAHGRRNPRADPHHGADRGNEAKADQRADNAAAEIAENVLARDDRDVDLSGQLLDRRGVEEERVERDVEHDDDRRADQERARQAALRIVHFADDIGRGIPARIRIHHEHEADRERRADHVGGSAAEGANEIGCGVAERKARDQEARGSEPTLSTVQAIWNALLWRMPRRSDQRHDPDDRRCRARSGGTPGRMALPYWPKAMAASATGAAKPTVAESQPARKPDGRMIGLAQKVVLAAGAGKHRRELAIGEYAAQRDGAADDPEQQQREAGRDALDLEAEARKHADADHVGHHNGSGGEHGHRQPDLRKPGQSSRASNIDDGHSYFPLASPVSGPLNIGFTAPEQVFER